MAFLLATYLQLNAFRPSYCCCCYTAAGYIVPHQCFMLCRLEELIAFDCLGAVSAVEKQLTRAMKNETYRQELLDEHKASPDTAQC